MSRKRKQDLQPHADTERTDTFKDMDAITAGMHHLRLADDRLAHLIKSFGAAERLLAKDTSCFRSLAKSIIYQQLAGSAAAAIYARFLTACGVPNESQLTPDAVLSASTASLRGCGLSERKASYLLDLAAHFQDGRLSDQLLTSVPDAELLQMLTAVRGIGPWTVDMFAMFHLGHPNILPVGDLGVRKGLAHLCGLKHLPSPQEMQELTEAWQPYRSLGCYYMWRIPLPPQSARQSSKQSSGSKGKSKTQQQQQQQELYRAPAPAFPLGGPVPAVADVGVNPMAPVLAAPSANDRMSTATLAAPAAAAAATGAAYYQPSGEGVLAGQHAAGAAGVDVAEQAGLLVTPAKPQAPSAQAAAGGAADAAVQQMAGTGTGTGAGELAAAAAAGEGVMTRRQLRWAQQQKATGLGSAAAADGVVGAQLSASEGAAGHSGYKARLVDL